MENRVPLAIETASQTIFVLPDGRVSIGMKVPNPRIGMATFMSIDDFDENSLGEKIQVASVGVIDSGNWIEVETNLPPRRYASLREAYSEYMTRVSQDGYPVFQLTSDRILPVMPPIPAH